MFQLLYIKYIDMKLRATKLLNIDRSEELMQLHTCLALKNACRSNDANFN